MHFQNADIQDVLMRSSACWQEALDNKVPLPIDIVRHYDSIGDMTAIKEPSSGLSKPNESCEGSFTTPTLPPLQTSTSVRQAESVSVQPVQP